MHWYRRSANGTERPEGCVDGGCAARGASSVNAQGFYWYGDPGYNPYQYPYPDRDGYARFDLNCMDAARLLRRDGFRVLDAIRCQRHLPFVYLAIGDDGRKYKVTISQFDGDILKVERVRDQIRNKKKRRKTRRRK
jgi:hypothetical protein